MKTQQDKILKAFVAFHEANPQVWKLFERFTLELIGQGKKHYNATGIFEKIRWYTRLPSGADGVKLNNNYRPYYARMFHRLYPQHDGFFHLRFCYSANRRAHRTYIGVHDSGPPREPGEHHIQDTLTTLIDRLKGGTQTSFGWD